MSNHLDYYAYLQSRLWEKNKKRAKKEYGFACSIKWCGKYTQDYHHLDYSFLWTDVDWMVIVPLCRRHHYLCHFTIWGKVPLNKKRLTKRYKQLQKQRWRSFRPSDVINWFIRNYSIE